MEAAPEDAPVSSESSFDSSFESSHKTSSESFEESSGNESGDDKSDQVENNCLEEQEVGKLEDEKVEMLDQSDNITAKTGNFVTVLSTTVNFCFVGVITDINDNICTITVMEKTRSGMFLFPEIDVYSEVHVDQILCILTSPDVDRRENYLFNSNEIRIFKIK